MSQKTTTPETAKKSKLSGPRGDTLNLPPPSGETELKVVTRSPGTETNNMKQLLNEFKGLHEQRLRWLELDLTMPREELLQKKEDFLRSYVNDLTDQNQVLVQTIEDLQMEADHKLLHTSDHILDDPNQQGATQELIHHLRHLRSDMNSITQLIQRTGHKHGLDTNVQFEKETGRGRQTNPPPNHWGYLSPRSCTASESEQKAVSVCVFLYTFIYECTVSSSQCPPFRANDFLCCNCVK